MIVTNSSAKIGDHILRICGWHKIELIKIISEEESNLETYDAKFYFEYPNGKQTYSNNLNKNNGIFYIKTKLTSILYGEYDAQKNM